MGLYERDILDFLMREGIVHPSRVTEGGLSILDASSRNRCFQVQTEDGTGCFVKQVEDSPAGRQALAVEAAAYGVLLSAGSSLGRWAPRCIRIDQGRGILVLELVPHAKDLAERLRGRKKIPRQWGFELGSAVAAIHRLRSSPPAQLRKFDPRMVLPDCLPTVGDYWRHTFGSLEVIKVLQRYSIFSETIGRLHEEWRCDAFIHGDLKLHNVLYSAKATAPRLKLVDWEIAGMGDAGWDIACVFSAFISRWLESLPKTGEAPNADHLALAGLPLASAQDAIGAFWARYTEVSGMDTRAHDDSLSRSMRFLGARLALLALESTQLASSLTSTVTMLLQLAHNILVSPIEAAPRLLGLHWRTA